MLGSRYKGMSIINIIDYFASSKMLNAASNNPKNVTIMTRF
ncbi:hypothetical protein bcgnr5414_64600 [Bacillus cereus]